MKHDLETKKGKILRHLQDGMSITPAIALRVYGHFRLAVCINRLRGEGFHIKTKMQYSIRGDQFAEYSLIK